jgi:7,8-dihydroneopterin aldolase/epimerase/oxygenase
MLVCVNRDWILLSGMSFPCLIGVFDWEQERAQTLSVEIALALDLDGAAGGDLGASVNYAEVLEEVQFIAREGRWRLLESMAAAILRHLLAPSSASWPRPPVEAVRIKLAKPEVFNGRAIPSIELLRERSWYECRCLRDAESPDVRLEILQETPETGAYHVFLPSGASWPAPAGAILYLMAGKAELGGRPLPTGQRIEAAGVVRASGEAPLLALAVTHPPLPGERTPSPTVAP